MRVVDEGARMRHFEFSLDVLAVIERDRFRHPDPLVRRRMEVLWLKAHGETHVRIAELAGVSRATMQRVLDQYQAGGLESVRTFHWHIPISKLAPHQSQLEEEFRLRPPHTVAEACQRIEQLTGVRRGPTRVCQFLRETMGLRWRKVAAVPVPPQQSLAEHAASQAAFLKDGA
jgi:transposase